MFLHSSHLLSDLFVLCVPLLVAVLDLSLQGSGQLLVELVLHYPFVVGYDVVSRIVSLEVAYIDA